MKKRDVKEMKRYKEILHGGDKVTIQVFPIDKNSKKHKPVILHLKIDEAGMKQLSQFSDKDYTIAMMVNAGDGRGRKKRKR